MKILITGAAGFVASHIIEYLNRNHPDYKLVGIDNLKYGYIDRIKDLKLDFIEEDIKNIKQIGLGSFDSIIHTAAIAPLPDNEIDPSNSYTENLINTIKMAEFSREKNCKKFIFLSSGAIYENDTNFPSNERIHLETNLVYPTSKMCAEHASRSYSNTYGLSTYALRLFNLYGPRQDFLGNNRHLLVIF